MQVYQGPSGFFKPHVDTPRSELQFGSLVVSLPCYHEGGQLIVRQQGHSTVFDWSKNDKDIQWAAFYSDCEHEVLEVTSGHRITLTYNLFVRRGLGEMAGHCDTLDARQLPLFKHVKEVLFDSNFMPKGDFAFCYVVSILTVPRRPSWNLLSPFIRPRHERRRKSTACCLEGL